MTNSPPALEPPPKKSRVGLFWIVLLAPAALALISFLCASSGPNDLGVMVGLIAAPAALISSIYCGIWLSRRFIKPGTGRTLFGLGMALVIGFANLAIVVAGCAANVSFH